LYRVRSGCGDLAHSLKLPQVLLVRNISTLPWRGKFKDANRNIAAVTHNPNGFFLGIIGLGKIGYRTAQKAQTSFEMKILYNDIRRMPAEIEQSINAKFYEKLDDMLADAGCVLGDRVMDAPHFAMMKRGSRLVNTARGKLIGEEAPVTALESGHLVHAGLGVHYNEPAVNQKLAKMENVQLLSRNAGASIEPHIGFERLGMENILSLFSTG